MSNKNSLGFASPLILGLVALVVIGAGAFFFFQKQSPVSLNKSSSSTTSKSDSSSFTFDISEKKLLFTGGYADPSVVKFKDKYILYVNKFGNSGSGNFIYTSSDGLNWQQTSSKAPGSATARAFVTDSGVRFYYPTLTPIAPSDPPSQILSAFSTDGLNFTTESGARMTPTKGYAIEGPSIIKLDDGKFRMYFNEFEESSKQEKRDGKIYGATSTDGLSWTRDKTVLIESDEETERISANWPQALRPFVLKRPSGGYVMFYNSHSQIYAAYSDDGYSFKKLGSIDVRGADVDGFYNPDGTIRIYFGDFGQETSGVVYTALLTEVEGTKKISTPALNSNPSAKNMPPPQECEGKKSTDSNLPEPCKMWFMMQNQQPAKY